MVDMWICLRFVACTPFKMEDSKYRKKKKWSNSDRSVTKRIYVYYILSGFISIFFLYVLFTGDFYFGGKCLKGVYKDYALVIHFDEPYYKDNQLMRELYDDVFGKVIICGPEPDAHSGRFVPDIEYESSRGLYGYNCMVLAVEKYGNYSGYFYSNYDVAMNWWNFQGLNTSKIWVLDDQSKNRSDISSVNYKKCTSYISFLERIGKRKAMKEMWDMYNLNQKNDKPCITRPSRFFYLPRESAKKFSIIGSAARVNGVPQDIGVATVMLSLTDANGYEYLTESYVPPKRRAKSNPELWSLYSSRKHVVHPYKLYNKDKTIWTENKKVLLKYFGFVNKLNKKC